jgi:hypothetical protein
VLRSADAYQPSEDNKIPVLVLVVLLVLLLLLVLVPERCEAWRDESDDDCSLFLLQLMFLKLG